MHTAPAHRHFDPAAGLHAALPLYDPLLRLIGAKSVQNAFVEQARLQPGQRVLDIGCGTGGVTLLAKRACPQAEVVGLDPDPRALAIARRKAERAGLPIRFDLGYADALGYADGSFDHVLSSFMWHHLPPETQRACFQQLRRVLAPGRQLHLIDFARKSAARSGTPPRTQSAEHLCDALTTAGFAAAEWSEEPRVLFMRVISCHAS
jgi:ubiquinone/menaquinone biosynthesis C-methylase UbiE